MTHYETKVDGLTVKLYIGLDGDYHVTREDSEYVHDHEIFDDFDKAKAFFDALVENKPFTFDDCSLPKCTLSKEREEEIDLMMQKMLPEAFDDYNIIFNDDHGSSDKGFAQTLEYCRNYIKTYAGTNESYFADYKGGVVSIVNNKTGQIVESYSVDNGKLIHKTAKRC